MSTEFNTVRKETPADIKRELKYWRLGACALDKYITWHKELAEERIDYLKRHYGLKVHNSNMVSDGWFDGMRVLQLIVETSTGALMKLKWMDSNQDFGNVRHGTAMLFEKDLA